MQLFNLGLIISLLMASITLALPVDQAVGQETSKASVPPIARLDKRGIPPVLYGELKTDCASVPSKKPGQLVQRCICFSDPLNSRGQLRQILKTQYAKGWKMAGSDMNRLADAAKKVACLEVNREIARITLLATSTFAPYHAVQ
jgi:hypothetical protein